MSLQLAPAEDLSLHHVLENGLAVLRSEDIAPRRRSRVLESLTRIFAEAGTVSQALHAQNLLFAIEQRPALDRFTLFFRYLHRDFGDNLVDRIQEASQVLDELKNREVPETDSLARTQDLIERLLSALNEERSLSPLEPPRSFISLS
jgi:hypothetical protein